MNPTQMVEAFPGATEVSSMFLVVVMQIGILASSSRIESWNLFGAMQQDLELDLSTIFIVAYTNLNSTMMTPSL